MTTYSRLIDNLTDVKYNDVSDRLRFAIDILNKTMLDHIDTTKDDQIPQLFWSNGGTSYENPKYDKTMSRFRRLVRYSRKSSYNPVRLTLKILQFLYRYDCTVPDNTVDSLTTVINKINGVDSSSDSSGDDSDDNSGNDTDSDASSDNGYTSG
jgi:hypothetical protein